MTTPTTTIIMTIPTITIIMSITMTMIIMSITIITPLRGIGASFTPTINALTGCCVFRLIWIFTVFQRYQTLESLYLVYPISWSITAIAHFVAFLILFRRLKLHLADKKSA